ncbi:hypothetical protein ACS0PU_011595 [Formica fusca]
MPLIFGRPPLFPGHIHLSTGKPTSDTFCSRRIRAIESKGRPALNRFLIPPTMTYPRAFRAQSKIPSQMSLKKKEKDQADPPTASPREGFANFHERSRSIVSPVSSDRSECVLTMMTSLQWRTLICTSETEVPLHSLPPPTLSAAPLSSLICRFPGQNMSNTCTSLEFRYGHFRVVNSRDLFLLQFVIVFCLNDKQIVTNCKIATTKSI